MFIAIEGTDASGKSTLIEAIGRELERRNPDGKIVRFHKGKPEELTRRWALHEYVTSVENHNWSRSVALADRWHWGEVTYAPKYRPETNKDGYGLLGKAGWRWVELFMSSRGMAQFWLYQPLDVIQKRLSSRGDEFVTADDLEEILERYHFAHDESMLTGTLSPEPDSIEDLDKWASYIVDMAQTFEDHTRFLEMFPYYIGSHSPTVLLVGDERNIVKKYGEETKLPFMPVDGNSAEYLLTALPDDIWKSVGIVNINDGNNKESFRALWQLLGQPKIAVLGRLAEKTISKIPIDESYYTVLPHPQYVRRFFNRTKEEYGQAILRVAKGLDKKEETWTLR